MKRYNHPIVDKTLRKIISNEMHTMFKDFFKDVDEILKEIDIMIKLLEPYRNVVISDTLIKQSNGIYNYGKPSNFLITNIAKLYNISEMLTDHLLGGASLYMMDIYLLKRLLDKDYITNAVIYTGAHHSINYIRILVKYFNFKITHYSYLKDDDINAAEKYIKKSENEEELNVLFFPPKFLQCSVLRDWPKNFE